jgi:hypothetical protein
MARPAPKNVATNSLFEQKHTLDSRAHPRVAIRPLHRLHFEFGSTKTAAAVANISVAGIGCFIDQSIALVPDKEAIGRLAIDKTIFEIRTVFVHRHNDLAGFRFVDPSVEVAKAIEEYFAVELSALKLTQVKSVDDDGTSRYLFQGDRNCELAFNEKGGKLLKFSLIFLGNYLEVEDGKILAVGQDSTRKSQMVSGVRVFEPSSVHPSILKGSIDFLESIPSLNEEHRKTLVRTLKSLAK